MRVRFVLVVEQARDGSSRHGAYRNGEFDLDAGQQSGRDGRWRDVVGHRRNGPVRRFARRASRAVIEGSEISLDRNASGADGCAVGIT